MLIIFTRFIQCFNALSLYLFIYIYSYFLFSLAKKFSITPCISLSLSLYIYIKIEIYIYRERDRQTENELSGGIPETVIAIGNGLKRNYDDETNCISLRLNALEKGLNLSLFLPAMGKLWADWYFWLSKATDRGERKTKFKTRRTFKSCFLMLSAHPKSEAGSTQACTIINKMTGVKSLEVHVFD